MVRVPITVSLMLSLMLHSAVGFAPLARLAPTPPSPRLAIPSMAADDQWDLDRLRSSISANQNARFGAAEALLSNPKDAWVLLFNEGRHDEGVYTLQCKSDPKTYMVAFECSDEAYRFADLLQAEGFDLAKPTAWQKMQLVSFCEAAGFDVSYVPEGTLFTPPTQNNYDAAAYDDIYNPKPKSDASLMHQRAFNPRPDGAIQRDGAEVSPQQTDPQTVQMRMRLEQVYQVDDYTNCTHEECDLE